MTLKLPELVGTKFLHFATSSFQLVCMGMFTTRSSAALLLMSIISRCQKPSAYLGFVKLWST